MSSNLYGPPTFADHLGGLIAEIDEVQKRVREQEAEEEAELLRECERSHKRHVLMKWRWFADSLKHREWLHNFPTVAEIVIAAELSALLD